MCGCTAAQKQKCILPLSKSLAPCTEQALAKTRSSSSMEKRLNFYSIACFTGGIAGTRRIFTSIHLREPCQPIRYNEYGELLVDVSARKTYRKIRWNRSRAFRALNEPLLQSGLQFVGLSLNPFTLTFSAKIVGQNFDAATVSDKIYKNAI